MADITIIGGINIDIEGNPYAELKYKDSNPGKIVMSYGGVGRNIVENAARLGSDVAMISVIGDDHMGHGAVEQLKNLGVDVSNIRTIAGESTSIYLSILNGANDMELALSDMEIINHITPQYLSERIDFLKSSKIVGLDGNLSAEFLDEVTEDLKGLPLFFDPVSSVKAHRAKNIIGRFHSIKPNLIETEVLTGMEISGAEDIRRAGDWFINKGVEQAFITLGKEGVYYKSADDEGFIKPHDITIVSATGAGDSFSAMILHGFSEGYEISQTAAYGMAAAAVAMESKSAVNEKMSMKEILKRI